MGAPAGGDAVIEHDAVLRGDARQLRRLPPEGWVLLLHPQLLGEGDPLEEGEQPQVGEGRPAVLRYTGGDDGHPDALVLALTEVVPDTELHGDVGVKPLGQVHPLRHDGLLTLGEMAEFLGELGRQGEDGVGHALVVLLGVGQAPAGQEGAVHVLPDAVGVDEGAVHIEKVEHIQSSRMSSKRQGKSLASSA